MGTKSDVSAAFNEAKSDAGESAEGGPNLAPDGQPSGPPEAGGGQDLKELSLQLQHISNILIAKGILSPQDIISPPALGAVPPPGGDPMMGGMPPGAPPMGGAPQGAPPPPMR